MQIHLGNGITRREARRKIDVFMRGKSQQEIVDHLGEQALGKFASEGLLVCCFSSPVAVATALPWSHYADHHRGVCIHFDTSFSPFRFALKVQYSETYPEVLVPRTAQHPWEAFQSAMLTKSHHWSYEHEYRLIRIEWFEQVRDSRISRLSVQWDGVTAIASPPAVKAITLGARMGNTERDELVAEISNLRLEIEVYQAQLHRSRYEIVRNRIS